MAKIEQCVSVSAVNTERNARSRRSTALLLATLSLLWGAPLLSQGQGTIQGTVEMCMRGEVRPAEGAVVRAMPHEVTPTALRRPWPPSLMTGADGSFTLEGLAAGVWMVAAHLPVSGLDSLGRPDRAGMEEVPLPPRPDRVLTVVRSRESTTVRLVLGAHGLDVSPSYVRITSGQSVQLTANVRTCQDLGEESDGRPITWTVGDDNVQISSEGVVTGVAPGAYAVGAASEGMEGTAVISVTAGAVDVDRILVQNNTVVTDASDYSGPETVVVIDANSEEHGGSVNDLVRQLGDLEFTNLCHKDGGCALSTVEQDDEIVVFSVDDRVVMDTGNPVGSIWTDTIGEVREVDVSGGLTSVPVVLWIAGENTDAGENVFDLATGDLEHASFLYNNNRAGIRFDTAETWPLWDPNATGAHALLDDIGLNSSLDEVIGCSDAVAAGPGFIPSVINVYYVPKVSTSTEPDVKGMHCKSAAAWNMIYISFNTRSETTLAHELGHAFGLGHEYDWPFNNIMCPYEYEFDDVERSELWLDQVFRINFDATSAMVRNGITPIEFQRDCTITGLCPLDDLAWEPVVP